MHTVNRKLLVVLLVAAAFLGYVKALRASDFQRPELVLQMLEFVKWTRGPHANAERYRVCVNTTDKEFKEFVSVAASLKSGRPVDVYALNRRQPDPASCHIVYLEAASPAAVLEAAAAIGDAPAILIVTDEGALRFGATIAIYLDAYRPALSIDVGVLEQRGVHVSSRLLRLAKVVY